jgi:hypothetical protein
MILSAALLLSWVQAASAVRVLLLPAEQQSSTAPALPWYTIARVSSLILIKLCVMRHSCVCQQAF